MKNLERPSNDPQRVDDPRPQVQEQTVEAARKAPVTHFVDPYDMRAEPPPEEPGYGHGV